MANVTQLASYPEDRFDTRFRGLLAPMEKRPGGLFQPSYSRDLIKASIVTILMTHKGERLFLPEFGSDVHKLIFEPNTQFVFSLATKYVLDAIGRWEPRVRVVGVDTRREDRLLVIRVTYSILYLSVQDVVDIFIKDPTNNR